ncbi:calcium-binding protein [Nocardioides sp. JQ2195]|uniref:M91 family zinc metallopeptidase n=1 Tax=Nocardioides sp. JQ2195 TaxID=2592334 RepID=UPI00143E9B60|nr:M91 family zinc metallopeptidase [Nocardioides sp. JQ2195]QIX26910.1 calcium-binding protein [Nocardioides sp. JQ2195]
MALGMWNLGADPGTLEAAATGWGDVKQQLTTTAEDITSASGRVIRAGWEGDDADAYDEHRRLLVKDINLAAAAAGGVEDRLDKVGGSLRAAKAHLDESWSTVAGIPHAVRGTVVTFRPADDDEQAKVTAAIARAREIRDTLDAVLVKDVAQLNEAKDDFDTLARNWVDEGRYDDFESPATGQRPGIITDGDTTIVNTGSGDDTVKIHDDPHRGDQIVEINGQVYRIPAGQEIVIRTGEGNDTVELPSDSRISITFVGGEGDDIYKGGAGDDTVVGLSGHDRLFGGDGADRISAGADRDYVDGQSGDDVLRGGQGNDTIYGGDDTEDGEVSDDRLIGNEGQDYLEGGHGQDTLEGGDGDDILSGGRDDDTIHGGDGDDVSYAGRGKDTTYGGSGTDTSYDESQDSSQGARVIPITIKDVPDFIKIEGSPEFQARVRADLEMLASSPRGQMMLANLLENHENSGFAGIGREGLTIREYNNPDDPFNSTAHDGALGGNVINYRPDMDTIDDGPPSVVLYHEMAHVYGYMNGTNQPEEYQGDDTQNHGFKELERQAAGLPIDHDNDPDTPEVIDPDHPIEFTENGLREEMGAPHRDHY